VTFLANAVCKRFASSFWLIAVRRYLSYSYFYGGKCTIDPKLSNLMGDSRTHAVWIHTAFI